MRDKLLPLNRAVCLGTIWMLKAAPLIIFFIALAGVKLGLDSDTRWGDLRIGLLSLGGFGTVVVLGQAVSKIVDRRLGRNRPRHKPSGFKWPRRFATVLVLLGIELVYVFMASAGFLKPWPKTSDYYDLLADAFAHGKASLLVQPPQSLQELDDPYASSTGPDGQILYDVSYFNGSYYLYWGPTPAAFLALLKLVHNSEVSDNIIAFLAVSLAFISSAFILAHLRKHFFPSVPTWLFLISLVIIGTSHPMLWILNYPTIYQAAIASGQAFLLAGLLVAIPEFDGSSRPRTWRLVLCGFLWTLAFGSRYTLAVPLAVLGGWLLIRRVTQAPPGERYREGLSTLLRLAAPALVGVVLLGLYNQVRFGNVLETGLQYQLNKGDTHMIVQGGALFNLRYFFSNLLYYTLGPLRLRASFPLVRPLIQPHPAISKLMAPLSLPSAYHLENVSGIVFAAPILLLSAVLGMHIVCRVIRLPYKALANDAPGDNSAATMGQLSSTAPILLAAIASALPTLFYFWVANRFLLDSTPLLAIAAVAGAWIVWSRSQGRPIEHAFLNAVIVILATVSLLIGLLLAFSGQRFLFDDLNPGVWHALSAPFLR